MAAVGGDVLRGRGGGGERDVDAARDQDDEHAQRQDRPSPNRLSIRSTTFGRASGNRATAARETTPSRRGSRAASAASRSARSQLPALRHRRASASSCSAIAPRNELADDPAVAHVQHAVAVEIDLRHLVGDQQDADAARRRARARARRCRCLLPMSTPTVGLSRISTLGSVASHLPSTTRCWLPPDRVLHRLLEAGDLDAPAARPSPRPGRGAAGRHRSGPSAARAGRSTAQDRLSLDRLAQVEAERQPVLGDIGDAGADRVLVDAQRERRARRAGSRRASGRVMPNSASASSVRPAPSSPVRPSTSPRCRVKRDVLVLAGAGQPAHLEQRLGAAHVARARPAARSRRRSSARRGAAASTSAAGEGADLAAVAQHGDPLGDLDHLLEPMADEDHRDALCLQPAHDAPAARRPRAGSARRWARP